MAKLDKFWALLIILLVTIIAAGGIIAISRYSRSQPVEIYLAARPESQGEISVDGAVNSPGIYPFNSSDGLGAIIRDAGGAAAGADPGRLKLQILRAGEGEPPQKVDLNRAEAWLLQALPGIGETRAKAIIDYRRKNGPFHGTDELAKVEGIGAATYEKIKHLITVTD